MRPLPQICRAPDYVLPTDFKLLGDTVVIEGEHVPPQKAKKIVECACAALKPGGIVLVIVSEQKFAAWSYILEDRGLSIKDCLCVATQQDIVSLVIIAMKTGEKTYFENALKHQVAGFWIDGNRIGDKVSGWNGLTAKGNTWNAQNCGLRKTGQATLTRGKFPSNFILAESHSKLQDFFHILSDENNLLMFLAKLTKTPYGGLIIHIAALTPLLYQAAIKSGRQYLAIVEHEELAQKFEELCHGND